MLVNSKYKQNESKGCELALHRWHHGTSNSYLFLFLVWHHFYNQSFHNNIQKPSWTEIRLHTNISKICTKRICIRFLKTKSVISNLFEIQYANPISNI